MAIAKVQHKAGTSSGATPLTLTLDNPTTAGNLIVVCIGARNGATGGVLVFSVSDNKGNTYTSAVQVAMPGAAFAWGSQIFYIANAAGGSSHQVTVTPAAAPSGNFAITVAEFSGIEAVSPLDKTGTGSNFSASPTTTSSGTLSQADELAVACLSNVAAVTRTPGSGYALLAEEGRAAVEFKVVSATTALVGDWTLSGNDSWAATLATFKASAGGGSSGSPQDYFEQQEIAA